MKLTVLLIAIASLALVGFAPPKKEACGSCDSKVAKKEMAKKEGGCAMEKKAGKDAKKHECCGKDPFIMEANRMAAAAEGKKSTGCACEDKAAAKKAAAKKAAKPVKSVKAAKIIKK